VLFNTQAKQYQLIYNKRNVNIEKIAQQFDFDMKDGIYAEKSSRKIYVEQFVDAVCAWSKGDN
jgi:hypothetical protein